MIRFSTFLVESLDVDKLKHLSHVEEHIIHGGHEGFIHALDNLHDVHKTLKGQQTSSKITTKLDGSPSIVFGKHPQTGQFFVASKSAFNKNPKINYTDEDIDANHGHAPGLASKLKEALKHLPKIMPHEGGVYQGDLMYGHGDVYQEGEHHKFTPNTITYSAHKDSAMGKRVANSKIGIAVHTKYSGTNFDNMRAGFDVDQSKFTQHPDVNTINPEIKSTAGTVYPKEREAEYLKHRENAQKTYLDIGSGTIDRLADHNDHIKPYINSTVRDGSTPSAKGYSAFLKAKRDTEIAKVKTDAAKTKKGAAYAPLIDDVDKSDSEFQKVLDLHGHIQKAKDTLVNALGNPTEFGHSVGGKEVKPEGFVITRKGRPTKLVDRAEFSKLNFANNRGRSEAEPEVRPIKESVLYEQESDNEVHHVFAFGRMNPPTTGHGALIDKVKDVAAAQNAGHSVVISRTQDKKKNPLTPEQKLLHAKRFFPNTNIQTATAEQPTFMHYLEHLHKQGTTHVTMVAGSDRVEEYKSLIDKYNGPGKKFNFKAVHVVSAGQRDPDADDVSGMSASKMRAHAQNANFSGFRKGIPQHVSDDGAKELYDHVRKGMNITESFTFNNVERPTSILTESKSKIKIIGLIKETIKA
jgi:hypothetical protein